VEANGGSFYLDLEESWVHLNAAVPTAGEWETMEKALAEEEVKKKSIDPKKYERWMKECLRGWNSDDEDEDDEDDDVYVDDDDIDDSEDDDGSEDFGDSKDNEIGLAVGHS
jgi:hypothetical protein